MLKILISIALLCCLSSSIHLQARRYYTNTDVENYIGGREGVGEYFNQVTRYEGNLIKCPFHKPFTVDGDRCFQCPIETPLYNLATKRC